MATFSDRINNIHKKSVSSYTLDMDINGSYLILNKNCNVEVHNVNREVAKFKSPSLICITSNYRKKFTVVSHNNYCDIWALKIPSLFFSSSEFTIKLSGRISKSNDTESFLSSPIKPGFVEIFHALKDINSSPEFNPISISSEYTHMMMYLLIWFAQAGKQDIYVGKVSLAEKIYSIIYQDIEKPWNLRSLASVLFMSESTIKRKLKEEGTSFSHIYTAARMSYAKELLLLPGMRVSTVAQKCGFTHVSYFVSCFKKQYGITPATYKRIS